MVGHHHGRLVVELQVGALGGMRSAAQIISYEIPAGLALLVPVLIAGTLSTQGLIQAQGGWPWEWYVFRNPFSRRCLLHLLHLRSSPRATAPPSTCPRPSRSSSPATTPSTPASASRSSSWSSGPTSSIIGAVATTLFLGGWQVPGSPPGLGGRPRHRRLPGLGLVALQFVSLGVFSLKTLLQVNIIIWIRWTLPRFRVDQMMHLCWKYLVPAGFLCMLFTLLWQMVVLWAPLVEKVTAVVVFAAFLYVTWRFLKQTRDNVSLIAHERVDLFDW